MNHTGVPIEQSQASFSEMADSIGAWGGELKKRRILVFLFVVFFSVLGLAFSYLKKPTYTAETTLMLEDNKSSLGGISSMLQIAGQFGIANPLGSAISEDKIVEILKSRIIITSALMKESTVQGKNDILANHYIRVYDLREKLDKEISTRNFVFRKNVATGTYIADSLLNAFNKEMIEKRITVSKYPKSGIITLSIETLSEELSKNLCEYMVSGVSEYYISNITRKEREAVEVIQERVDSIRGALNDVENKYANWKDATNRLIKVRGYIEEVRLRREIEILSLGYGEAVKHLELAKFNLLINTPLLQTIDTPVLPLKKNELKWWAGLLFGAFTGLFAGMGFAIVRFTWSRLRESA